MSSIHHGLARVVTVCTVLLVAFAGPASAVGNISDTLNIRVSPNADDNNAGANDPVAIALRFSQATFPDNGRVDAQSVVIATGETFADALASGTVQGDDSPLLLTSSGQIESEVLDEIERLGVESATILGGTRAISVTVEEDLEDAGLNITRIDGITRLETAAAVAAEAASDADTAIIARGFGSNGDDTQAFADALAAGAWAAEEGWPVLLTQTEVLSTTTHDAIIDSGIERVIILGGPVAIAPRVQSDLRALEVGVLQVFGDTRFDTAVKVAAQRGFAHAADAERVILVEGQADDAWAAGFAAAAHGARFNAPVVLANGDILPQPTVEFLSGAPFDADDVTTPVLVCAASATACDQARDLLNLPREATISLQTTAEPIPSRTRLAGVLELFGEDARVTVTGACVMSGPVIPTEDGAFSIEINGPQGPCDLMFEISFDNGSVQTITRGIEVDTAAPATGVVVDTQTGGDSYAFVPAGSATPLTVTYTADDVFTLDGESATIGAFEAAITVADMVTYSAQTPQGDQHELVDVSRDSIGEGSVGNVNLGEGTFDIIEPVSGVALRNGLQLTDGLDYQLNESNVSRQSFEAAINEGDLIAITPTSMRLTDRSVEGMAQSVSIDQVSGIARLQIGALGDDPLTAEDVSFRTQRGVDTQNFRVDGSVTDFDGFIEQLTNGDTLTYDRRDGVETFALTNTPLRAVQGTATEDINPDGSPVAPQPRDGGEVTVLTSTGRARIAYSVDALFRVDGRVATEAEFEAALTPGDDVTYQSRDADTRTEETMSIRDRDLVGSVTDISEGANTYDVTTTAGLVYDDLDYTAGVFGGTDLYRIDGDVVSLAQFENELSLVDRGEVKGAIIVRAVSDGTEHSLTLRSS